mgnify:FL=1
MVNINKIESLIKDKGWSNTYFCTLFDKNKGWIRDWKRNRGLPDENTLQSIADKLGTTVDYLTDKSEQKEKPPANAESLSDIENEILEIYHNLPADKKQAFITVARSLKSNSEDK